VSLDEVYAEIENAEIPSEVRRELNSVAERLPAQRFSLERILRALYLLQQVQYAPHTLDNLARLLTSRVDVDFSALRSQVEAGLEQLIAARYVARTGDQYEYLSGERKRIEEEIAEEDVRTAHKRDRLKEFLTAANLEVGTIRYEDAFRFDVRVICDDQVVVSKGGIEVRMISSLKALLDGVRAEDLEAESLATPNTLYWLARPSSEIERLLDRIERLERVVKRYEADSTKSPEMEGIVRKSGGTSMSVSSPSLSRNSRTACGRASLSSVAMLMLRTSAWTGWADSSALRYRQTTWFAFWSRTRSGLCGGRCTRILASPSSGSTLSMTLSGTHASHGR
jgi:hypothetical protein